LTMVARGAGCFAIAPIQPLHDLILNRRHRQTYRPEWLNTLAKGVDYYPDAEKQPLERWRDDELVDVVQQTLKDAFDANYAIFRKEVTVDEKNLNHSVHKSKIALYVSGQYDGLYQFYKNFPPVHFNEDPARGELLLHMSTFMVYYHITPKLDRTGSVDSSDMDVLKSIESHTERGSITLEGALAKSPVEFRDSIGKTIDIGYRMLEKTYDWMREANEQEMNKLKYGTE